MSQPVMVGQPYAGGTNRGRMSLYRCECGVEFHAAIRKVQSGKRKWCSECRNRKIAESKVRHGAAGTQIYFVWQAMHKRCRDSSDPAFDDYGGRGIRVCESWGAFENFYADMGDRPQGAMIERRNNDGDYEPSNCYWASRKEQNRNRRNNLKATISGVTRCVAEWADELGVPRSTLYARIHRGATPEEAVARCGMD